MERTAVNLTTVKAMSVPIGPAILRVSPLFKKIPVPSVPLVAIIYRVDTERFVNS